MSAINQTDVISTDYLIEPNPQFDFNHRATDAYVLQNVAESVNYRVATSQGVNKTSLAFNINPGNNFMSRGFILNVDLPLVFERTKALETDPDKDDYVTTFFEDYSAFAWKQFGFLNAIDNITIGLPGMNLNTVRMNEMLKIVSRYYDEEIVHQRIPHSLPDCMDYDRYKQTSTIVKTIATDGATPLLIKPSIINTHNPFGTMGNPDFNTRTPMVTFSSFDATTKKPHGVIKGVTCFIPFSIFGIPGLDTQPLVGVQHMTVNMQLKANWEKHLFCTHSAFMKSVAFDDDKLTSFNAELRFKTYIEPQYIKDAHGLGQKIPDYNLKMQICEVQPYVQSVKFAATDNQKTLSALRYPLRAIPKAVYIAATMKANNDDDVINTPNVFARIDALTVEVSGKTTILPKSPQALMEIAKANGYQDSTEIGLYLGGFPLKLNMSDDLGAQTNTLVGSRNMTTNEFVISDITLTNVAHTGIAVEYDIQVVFVYDGMIAHRDKNYILFQSLLDSEKSIGIEAHISELYNAQIPNMNMVGGSLGSLFTAALPTLKKMGKGAFNVIKKYATDKQFRGQVMDAFNAVKQTATPAPQPTNFVEQSSVGARSSHTPYGGFSNQIGGKEVYHTRPVRY